MKSDSDTDADDHGEIPNDDEEGMVAAGHGAGEADRQAIEAVLRSYYTSATAANGAKGCSLLDARLATAAGATQLPTGVAKTCATSLSRLFKQQHQYLAAEDAATMVVTGVHVNHAVAVATLGFRAMPETEILLQREGGSWRLGAIFDSPLP